MHRAVNPPVVRRFVWSRQQQQFQSLCSVGNGPQSVIQWKPRKQVCNADIESTLAHPYVAQAFKYCRLHAFQVRRYACDQDKLPRAPHKCPETVLFGCQWSIDICRSNNVYTPELFCCRSQRRSWRYYSDFVARIWFESSPWKQ